MVTDKADIHMLPQSKHIGRTITIQTNIYLESDSVYALGLLKKYLTTT